MSDGLPGPARSISRHEAQWMLGLLGSVLVLLSLLGEPARLALRYEREAVLQGELWRLITCHLVHGTWLHLLLNLCGVGLIVALFPRDYSLRGWLLISAFSMLAIAAGFVFYEPQLEWYVGLSGVLHGLLTAGGISWWRHESRRLSLALTLIFVGKITWEQLHGPLPLSGDLPVIVDAHLYGALGGTVAGLTLWLREYTRSA